MTESDVTIQFLRSFVYFGGKPGELIELGPLRFPVSAHFPAAMDYAAAKGWVEKSDPDQYRLTEAGLAAAQVSN